MNHYRSTVIVAGTTALIAGPTLIEQSPPAGTGTSPSLGAARKPDLVVVADTDVKVPLPRGTCPENDLVPVQVLTLGPCGRFQPLARRRAGGGSAGGINIAHVAPSPR
jgi:hypothetical protein